MMKKPYRRRYAVAAATAFVLIAYLAAWLGFGLAQPPASSDRPVAPTAKIAVSGAVPSRGTLPATPAAPSRKTREGERPATTGCVIVRYAPGVEVTGSPVAVGNSVIKPVPEGMTPEQYIAELSRQPGVLTAEPDHLFEPATTYTSTPNDPDYVSTATLGAGATKSWALRDVNSSHFDEVWPALNSAEATGGQVRVAVVDTGFYFDHPDARFSAIRAVADECETYNPNTGRLTTDTVVEPVVVQSILEPDPILVASHGTMTASEVGAAANNLVGSLGATYDTGVDIYKVMGVASEAGQGLQKNEAIIPESAIINAINHAVAASKRDGYRLVINVSLQLVDPDVGVTTLLDAAIKSARSKGVLVICAAGNYQTDAEKPLAVRYPAASPYAIAVGACTVSTQGVARDWYSSSGPELDIMAAGTNVWGPVKPGSVVSTGDAPGYHWWTGTSMASPLVASAAALLLRVEPTLTATEVVAYLQNGARDLGTTGRDDLTGWGYLDAYQSYYLMAVPHTTADVKPLYPLQATIHFTVKDRDSGPNVTTFYSFDGGPTLSGQSATLSWVGMHWIQYWSVDSNGVAEPPTTMTFEIVLDATPPVTTADVVSTYAGRATIHLSATDVGPDSRGLGSTFYSLDGAATREGTLVSTGRAGRHTISYWSQDLVGNVETPRVATFTVQPLPSVVTLSRSASTIRRGSRVRFSGALTPGRVGDYVRIQVKTPGSRAWRYIGAGDYRIYRRTVTSVGAFDRGTWSPVTIALRSRGKYYFRAVFSGDSTIWARAGDVSSTVSVTVR